MKVFIHQGDTLKVLRRMASDAVDCIVTSPPYWGLRDYGVPGQIGLEPTLGEHLDVMLEIFRELRRILKPDGTLWLNYGDCYATTPNGRSAAATKAAGGDDRTFRDKPFSTVGPIYRAKRIERGGGRRGGGNLPAGPISENGPSLKPKDLCMIPNRLAILLQEDGWWVRGENIWGKPNPMPESVNDRPASAHEKIFLLTKSEKYFYDADAVRQPMAAASGPRLQQDIAGQEGSTRANGGRKTNGTMKAVAKGNSRTFRGGNYTHEKQGSRDSSGNVPNDTGLRSLRNYETAPPQDDYAADLQVWRIAAKGFKGAHFATFPPALAERCILAGCRPGGTVLDPFGGSGTVGLVAHRQGRNALLIELNPDYIKIADTRLRQQGVAVQINSR